MALGASAQSLNTEITVNHEVVPEEQAATRMRVLPAVNLPDIKAGRLPVSSRFMPTTITPFISPLSAAQYADTIVKSPWRGYGALGYGPVYNLMGSWGSRVVDREYLAVNAYLQFDGMSYKSKYPGINYDGKVVFRRNTVLGGGDVAYTVGAHHLTGALLYQYSHYNYPILDLPTLATDKNIVNANVVKANAGWKTSYGQADIHASADYGMIYFGKNKANNNRVAVRSGAAWHSSTKSTWTFDFNFSIDHSAAVGNKNIFELHPAYNYASKKLRLRVGLDVDIPDYDAEDAIKLRVIPELAIDWRPIEYFKIWLNSTWDMVDNNRLAMYDEQPYLLQDFDTRDVSGIWKMQAGIGLGPFRGASINVYVTPTIAENWYIPAFGTGYMTNRIPRISVSSNPGESDYYAEYSYGNHIGGCLFGVSFSYDYRRYLSLNVTGEYSRRDNGDYYSGYAPWRDHAKYNLMAQATIRPINKLEVNLGYQLRTGREKMIGDLYHQNSLNLRNISNLQAGVSYKINERTSVWLRGENLLNRHWYLGPAVPSQGIMGMIGVIFKIKKI